ncbi:MAG: sulfurtransferase [Gammaproteobacteria bacterium]|nr:sulfurtransferase [Gammaproteobacteria bacterium]
MNAEDRVMRPGRGALLLGLWGLMLALASPVAAVTGGAACGPDRIVAGGRPEVMISAPELYHGLKDGEPYVVVDTRSLWWYALGHIEGARHLPVEKVMATVDGVPQMLAPPEQVAEALGKAGIAPDDTVVLYSDAPYKAARVWWTLHNYGHRKVRVLDGGIMGWHRYAFPTTILWPFHRETDYPVPEPRQPLVVDLRQTFRALDDDCAAVIDVRDREEYVGDVVHAGTEEKGRIAGSTHIHWSAFLDDFEKLKSTPEIVALLEDHGISPNQRIITYCHIGLRSSHTVMALYAAGFPADRIGNYDGSWMEWSVNPSLPMAGGEGMGNNGE